MSKTKRHGLKQSAIDTVHKLSPVAWYNCGPSPAKTQST